MVWIRCASLVSSDDSSSFTKIDLRTLSCFPADSLIENSQEKKKDF